MSAIGLRAARWPNETWRECVNRNAAAYGLQEECLSIFDRLTTAEGIDEHQAAWNAMYEWDLGLEVEVFAEEQE